MSFELEIGFNTPNPDACPLTVTELIALLDSLIVGTLEGEFKPYVTGAGIPSVEDQDKVWMRTDAQGRPIGTYQFYSGTWRRQYTAPIGTVVMYEGDPNVDFSGAGGAGTIGGEWDGWNLCNGQNGTSNLSDRFIVAAKMDDLGIGHPGEFWQTNVSGSAISVGDGGITLNETNTFIPATEALRLGHWEATGNNPEPGGGLIGLESGDVPAANFDLIEANPGNPTPPAIQTLPPFYALAFVVFQGY